MNESQIETMEQVRGFLQGAKTVEMAISSKSTSYNWIRRTLVRFEYMTLGKADRGSLLQYLQQVSGYSRSQITRLVSQFKETGNIERRQCATNGFTRQYTPEDIRLLAQLDELHGTLSGQAAKKLCERAYHIYGQGEYENLSAISVSHLYNLRRSDVYRHKRRRFQKTRPVATRIGERRKPKPRGKAGATFASTRSIRAIRMAGRGFITSMPSMKSPSSKLSALLRGSVSGSLLPY